MPYSVKQNRAVRILDLDTNTGPQFSFYRKMRACSILQKNAKIQKNRSVHRTKVVRETKPIHVAEV